MPAAPQYHTRRRRRRPPPRTQLPKETTDQDTRRCRCKSSRARFFSPSSAPMSPPPLPQFTASSLPDISSLSWHLVHLAGGHHHQGLRDEFLLSFKICVMFPGEISCCHAKVCAFVLIPYDTQAQKRGPKREIYSRIKYMLHEKISILTDDISLFSLDAETGFLCSS